MDIIKAAVSGTMESSDAYVEIEPAATLDVQVESVVQEQFGPQIRQAVFRVLEENQVNHAAVRVIDRGALACVIQARVETAILRGKGEN